MKFVFPPQSRVLTTLLCLCSVAAVMWASAQVIADDGAAKTAEAGNTAAKKQTVTIFQSGKLVVPAKIKRVEPANNVVEHEFEASVGDGDDGQTARVTLMPAMGGVKANVDRWISQFSGDKRKVSETKQSKSGKWDVHVVKISGTYAQRMGGGFFAGGRVIRHEDYAMMGAVLVEPQGESRRRREYFVKMIGPAPVIDANEDAFKKMVKSVGQ